MIDGATPYDRVRYPAGLFPTTLPSHLAAIARLHGLDAPDPRTARVLEIAGGDGMNLIAMAAAFPDASFHSFDISGAAVARGQALAAAAGLGNIRIEQADLLDAAEALAGPYDYVIVHGLYAWVPDPVRAAALRLAGRVLSPQGIALVSYNAQPGGHLRTAIREMMLHHMADIADPAERIAAARSALRHFAAPRATDRPVAAALRQVAEPMIRKNDGSLFHDELGECYAPQSLSAVVAAAAPHGLAFLNDAVPTMIGDGLPGEDMDDAAVVRAAQADDYVSVTFFHQTLFVRPGRAPQRRVTAEPFAHLHASTGVRRTGATSFVAGDDAFEIEDPRLANLVGGLGEVRPLRASLAPFADSAEDCAALAQLFQRGIIDLHAVPLPAAAVPGERPVASPVARAQIAAGEDMLYTLDHQLLRFAEPGPRAFLSLLDGTRDRAQIAADWAATPFGGQIAADKALEQVARAAMLVA